MLEILFNDLIKKQKGVASFIAQSSLPLDWYGALFRSLKSQSNKTGLLRSARNDGAEHIKEHTS
mgnify:CR=1 FL=1